MILWEEYSPNYNIHHLNLNGDFVSTTVESPMMPGISTLINKNIKNFLLPSDLISWWSAVSTTFRTNKPQFTTYSLIAIDQIFLALIDKLSDKTIVVYEILEKNILNRKFLKKILLEAAQLSRTV